jgi:hypothetical protein
MRGLGAGFAAIASGALTPSTASALRSTWAVAASSAMRAAPARVVDEEALGGVPAVQRRGQVAQVERHVVRRQVGGGAVSISG